VQLQEAPAVDRSAAPRPEAPAVHILGLAQPSLWHLKRSKTDGRQGSAGRTLYVMDEPQHRIRALHTASTITVYQAYAPEIGLPAVQEGRFPAAWKRDRMT